MERFTHLGRTIDPRHPSNLFVIVATIVMAGVSFAVGGLHGEPEWGGPVAVGLATFLSWALGRELDPDHVATANLSAIAGGMVALGSPSAVPGALYLLLVAVRILVRTTGLPPRWTDLAIHVLIAAWLAMTAAGWIGGMALAFAIGRDIALPRPAPGRQARWAIGMAVAVTAVASLSGVLGAWNLPSAALSVITVLGTIGAAVLIGPETPSSTGDLTGEPLDGERLNQGRILVVVAAVLALALVGDAGARALAPVWTTLAIGGALRMSRRRR